jgi:hypothetical protein
MRAEMKEDGALVCPRCRRRLLSQLIHGPVDRTRKGKAIAGEPQTSGYGIPGTCFPFLREPVFGLQWLILY